MLKKAGKSGRILALAGLFSMVAISSHSLANEVPSASQVNEYLDYFKTTSPWPEVRKQRVEKLLPQAMAKAEQDLWLVVCRENDNDPLAKHVGCENAGGTAVILFAKQGESVSSTIFSPVSESTALKELKTFDKVIDVDKGDSAIKHTAKYLSTSLKPSSIAVNSFTDNPQADGLSHTQYLELSKALKSYSKQAVELVSAENIIYHWLARKLPVEVEIMAKAAAVTSRWEYEAYQQVIPGVTTDKDVADFLDNKIAEAGLQDAWSPSQNPAVNSGPDRGHSHPTNRVIQPGDVIQIDFGIKVFDQWVTDVQRFAYVLKPGETEAPADIKYAWQNALKGGKAAFDAMKPGVSGESVNKAQKEIMKRVGSLPVIWSTGHPVGYVAHDTGPNLGVRSASEKALDVGMTFSFDGFYSWPYKADASLTKTISVEEMVVIEPSGARFLTPPQKELVLISSQK